MYEHICLLLHFSLNTNYIVLVFLWVDLSAAGILVHGGINLPVFSVAALTWRSDIFIIDVYCS